MDITGALTSLTPTLYELPKKAAAYLTIDLSDHTCASVKTLLKGAAIGLNQGTGGLNDAGMREYAINGMSKVENFLNYKEYVSGCDPSYQIPRLTETAQKVVNYAVEYAREHGISIPEFGDIASLVLKIGIAGVVIGGIYLTRCFNTEISLIFFLSDIRSPILNLR